MSMLTLTKTMMREGLWEGMITQSGDGLPQVEVLHQGKPIDGVVLARDSEAGHWVLQFHIPPEALSDGLQTLVISDKLTSTRIGSVSLMAGEALGDDLRAEVDLLRAELDMLKRAFRRHCLETA